MSENFDQKIKMALAAIEIKKKEELELQNQKNDAFAKLNAELMDTIKNLICPILDSAKKAINSNQIGILKYNIDSPSIASRPKVSFGMENQRYKNPRISATITYDSEWYINISPYKKNMVASKDKIGDPLDENLTKILSSLIDDLVKISQGYGSSL
ncbi:hypothetical protein V5F40_02955 [Xanthobacter sp. DSM 14520]|uniref:hypothetical protein n=1 Tax=Xanthobacter autotrophicus (strain ATCC BAA-1158 / Py2) TaxID=78245 RepID=UPI0037277A73